MWSSEPFVSTRGEDQNLVGEEGVNIIVSVTCCLVRVVSTGCRASSPNSSSESSGCQKQLRPKHPPRNPIHPPEPDKSGPRIHAGRHNSPPRTKPTLFLLDGKGLMLPYAFLPCPDRLIHVRDVLSCNPVSGCPNVKYLRLLLNRR